MLADRAGRLEDRPKRIKVELFPYEMVNVEEMLRELDSAGFIHRYSIEGGKFIQIRTFEKHQQCHHREPESTLPDEFGVSPGQARGKPGTSPSLAQQEKEQEGKGAGREGKGAGAGAARNGSARVAANVTPAASSAVSDFFSNEFLDGLQRETAYRDIDVRHVAAKLIVWCKRNRRTPDGDRLLKWLNREEPTGKNRAKEPGNGRESEDNGKYDAKYKRVAERIIARRRSGEKEGGSA